MKPCLSCLILLTFLWCSNAFNLVIQIHYPQVQLGPQDALTLRGSGYGLNWNSGVPLTLTSDNIYSTTLTGINIETEEILEVKAMYNTYWQIGSNTIITLYPAGATQYVDTYPWFFSNTGSYEVAIKNLWSPQLNNSRPLVIYTPPSYPENDQKTITNVLIMHDGQNLFNASTSAFGVAWLCQNTVDSLVNGGQMEEVLIVGVYNDDDRTDEYTYSYDPSEGAGGKGDLYLDFLQETVIPWVSDNYRVSVDVANLGILGSSLGGLISCYAGWTRNDIYSKAGCMSSSFWWNNEDFNNQILVNDSSPVPVLEGLYLDSGNAGPDNDDEAQTKAVRNHIQKLGYKLNDTLFYYLDNGGQHSEAYWGARFWVPMTDLYPIQPIMPYS